jgi:hypothetical protein
MFFSFIMLNKLEIACLNLWVFKKKVQLLYTYRLFKGKANNAHHSDIIYNWAKQSAGCLVDLCAFAKYSESFGFIYKLNI